MALCPSWLAVLLPLWVGDCNAGLCGWQEAMINKSHLMVLTPKTKTTLAHWPWWFWLWFLVVLAVAGFWAGPLKLPYGFTWMAGRPLGLCLVVAHGLPSGSI